MKFKILMGLIGIACLCSPSLQAKDKNPANTSLSDTVLTNINEEDKIVNIPFSQAYRKNIPGFVTTINPEEFLMYDNIGGVSAALAGRVPGVITGTNLHGLGAMVVFIDGIPGDIGDVNLEEVEQITILKDANSAMFYGVQAGRGVIMITTKRGKIGKRLVEFTVDQGFASPISLPKFLGSADYMELYNEALVNDSVDRDRFPDRFFTDANIDSTRNGVNKYRYPDTDYYSSEFLRNIRPSSRYRLNFSGGNLNTQYFLQLGLASTGSLLAMGEEERSNSINVRSNINFKVNDFMKAYIDLVGRYDIDKGPRGNFWGDAATLRPNLYTPLIDTALVLDMEQLEKPYLVENGKLLGGTSIYRNNIYGNLLSSGYQKVFNSAFNYRTGLDIDLNGITEGLSFRALASFTFNANYTESQNNSYAIYEPKIWTYDAVNQHAVDSIEKHGTDIVTGTQGISGNFKQRRIGYYGSLDYSRTFSDLHSISASVLAFSNLDRRTGNLYETKFNHLGARVNYVYNSKYILNYNSVFTSALHLDKGNRLAYSPSIGLGWVISREDFFEGISGINYLKLKASAGKLNTDYNMGSYYRYRTSFSQGSNYFWADNTMSNNMTNISNIGNNFLDYEKRMDLQLGAEAGLFNNALWLDVSYFRENYSDQVIQLSATTPDFLGGNRPWVNYNEDQYQGLDLGLTYHKTNNKFSYEIGGSFTFLTSKTIKIDEDYENDYQYRVGKRTDAIWGLQADGFFVSDSAINANYSQNVFGTIRSGDIKYINQNSDTIVDQNDIIMIGNNLPDVSVGLHLRLSYGNFTFFALATGTFGAETYFNNDYYQVYGDIKYSESVLNRWTEETASTATYPKLSSGANSNNFRNSTFWLYDNSRISINRMQLTYDIQSLASKLNAKNLGLYIKADNLVMFAKNRDKIQLNYNSQPQYVTYSIGLRAIF